MKKKPTYEELEIKINKLNHEISQLKTNEKAHREGKNWIKTVINATQDAMISIDDDGLISLFNPAAAEMFGRSKEEMIGKQLDCIIPADYRPEDYKKGHYKAVEALFENSKYSTGIGNLVEFTALHKDGHTFPIEISLSRGEIASQRFVIAIARDISKRKKAETALKESQDRLALALEAGNSGMWDFNPYTFTDAHYSDGWFKMLGYQPSELPHTARTWINLLHPDDHIRVMKKLRDHINNNIEYSIEYRMKTKTGKDRWVHSMGKVISWDKKGNPQRMIGIQIDIHDRKTANTERKELEAQLQHTQKMEAIGTMAGGIAHDFNNILGIILGNTELAIDILPEWNPVQYNLEEIKKTIFRAKDVIMQILNLCRKTDLIKKPVQLTPVIKDSLKLLRSIIPTSVEIRYRFPKDNYVILADPTQIHQIMINLCTNAAHAMQGNGGRIDLSIRKHKLDNKSALHFNNLLPGNYIKLSVADTGHGIPPEVLGRIFDPYFTTKQIGKGTGMGLSVVHGIVKNFGGDIKVSSKNGNGTIFDVYFPLLETPAQIIELPIQGTVPKGNGHILLVDDEEPIAEMMEKLLNRLGYEVDSYTSSTSALDAFRSDSTYDLVITDMTMPDLTGDKLAEKLLKINPDIPIIICTGYNEEFSEEEVKEMGISKFLLKPVTSRNLAETIREVLINANNDRRKFKRFKVQTGAMVKSMSTSDYQGRIVDISKGGFAFYGGERKDLSKEFSELSIILSKSAFSLDKIPCKAVVDLELMEDAARISESTKRYGIQFGELSHSQKNQLEFFIENHTV